MIEVAPYALNQASLHCSDVWKFQRQQEEGLYAWLQRIAETYLRNVGPTVNGFALVDGLKLGLIPVASSKTCTWILHSVERMPFHGRV